MKICIQCNLEKDLSNFYLDKRIKDEYRNKCKSCVKENTYNWRYENKEKGNIINKNWRNNNFLGADPASTIVKHWPVNLEAHANLLAAQGGLPPEKR